MMFFIYLFVGLEMIIIVADSYWLFNIRTNSVGQILHSNACYLLLCPLPCNMYMYGITCTYHICNNILVVCLLHMCCKQIAKTSNHKMYTEKI